MARLKIGNVFPPLAYLLKHCAPAGYGLGNTNGRRVLWADIDTAKEFGIWGIWGDDGVKMVNGLSFTYATMLVIPMDANAVTQLLLPIGTQGLALVRRSTDDIWQEWEWIDPPMTPGVEYRTTETWYGSPVYTVLIETGGLSEAKYIVDTNIPARRIIHHYGYIEDISLPFIDGTLDSANSAWVNATIYNEEINLIFHVGTALLGKGAVVQLWYLK